MDPQETPTAPPSKATDGPGKRPTATPGATGAAPGAKPSTVKPGAPAVTPSASAKPTPGSTAKEPTPVPTACTGWAHSNRSDGYGRMTQNSHLYAGPYAECSASTAIKSGVKVYYHCYVTNAYGNKWIYGRIEGTKTEGWLFSEKSSLDSGSLVRC